MSRNRFRVVQMALASTVGRDRPDEGGPVVLTLDGTSWTSRVHRSGEVAIVVLVPRARDGRLVRLALGAEVAVAWSDLGRVRSRRYAMVEVVGGTDPRWRLVPAATAGDGNRRSAPRADVVVPVAVVGPDGMVVGSTADLSTTGARLAFPPPTPGSPARALPPAAARSRVVVLLDETRLEFEVHVVRVTSHPDGRRELRVAFADLDPATRAALDSVVAGQLVGGRPSPGDP